MNVTAWWTVLPEADGTVRERAVRQLGCFGRRSTLAAHVPVAPVGPRSAGGSGGSRLMGGAGRGFGPAPHELGRVLSRSRDFDRLPSLVVAAVGVPLVDGSAVGGLGFVHVGLVPVRTGLDGVAAAAGRGDQPLLADAPAGGPQPQLGAGPGGCRVDVEGLAAADTGEGEVAAAGVRQLPLLAGAVLVGLLDDGCAVAGSTVRGGDRLAGADADDLVDAGQVAGRFMGDGQVGVLDGVVAGRAQARPGPLRSSCR